MDEHRPRQIGLDARCAECNRPWPCPTVKARNGDPGKAPVRLVDPERPAGQLDDDGNVIVGCMYALVFSAPVWAFLAIMVLLWWLQL